ncbi:MAG: hypothetical protein KF775_02245 [Cyclobacteriaceae bacterium]|nr:hypothetical protein [Cyclobacteriaceae bacterium]
MDTNLNNSLAVMWFNQESRLASDQIGAINIKTDVPKLTKDLDETLQLMGRMKDILTDKSVSENPWNRPEFQYLIKNKYKVLKRGLLSSTDLVEHEETVFALDATRISVGLNYDICMKQVLRIYLGAQMNNQVILDRQARIIDGLQTVHACKVLGVKFNCVMIDYENSLSRLI